MMRPRRIGLPWYRPEQYARLRTLMVDGERLPALYDPWRLSAEQIAGEIERSGIEIVRVEIDMDSFGPWCAYRGLALDGAARSRFAKEAVEDAQRAEVAAP